MSTLRVRNLHPDWTCNLPKITLWSPFAAIPQIASPDLASWAAWHPVSPHPSQSVIPPTPRHIWVSQQCSSPNPEWDLWPLSTTVLPRVQPTCCTQPHLTLCRLPLCVTVAGCHLFQGCLQVSNPPDGRFQVCLEGLSHCCKLLYVLLLEIETTGIRWPWTKNPSHPRELWEADRPQTQPSIHQAPMKWWVPMTASLYRWAYQTLSRCCKFHAGNRCLGASRAWPMDRARSPTLGV